MDDVPLIVGLTSGLGTLILGLILITVWLTISSSRSSGRIRLGGSAPGSYDDEQQFLRDEVEAIEAMDEQQREAYFAAKAFIQTNPPNSAQSEISLGQYMTIQEKGVAAWEFQMDLFANTSSAALSNAAQSAHITCFVENRTELQFLGGVVNRQSEEITYTSPRSVQTNLPLPKNNETYYWEVKMYDKPADTTVAVGLCTKPYPLSQLPGQHRYSVGFESTGHKRNNQPFTDVPKYGLPFNQGDVVGVGYRPRSGTIFFTRNGKRLEEVVHGMRLNLFPTVGATGPCQLHVNFGQSGFVFIEANVKKWGLAPVQGNLAPPPPYGRHQQNSLLLESEEPEAEVDEPESPPPSFERTLTSTSTASLGDLQCEYPEESINLAKLTPQQGSVENLPESNQANSSRSSGSSQPAASQPTSSRASTQPPNPPSSVTVQDVTDYEDAQPTDPLLDMLEEAQSVIIDPPQRSLNTSPPPSYRSDSDSS
ncbi:Protein ssh4 [Yarrowia sp. B02]|nr:Protein ssh4 [Yarrowia sp. B02]